MGRFAKVGRTIKLIAIVGMVGWFLVSLPAACQQLHDEAAATNSTADNKTTQTASIPTTQEKAASNSVGSTPAESASVKDDQSSTSRDQDAINRVWFTISQSGTYCDKGTDPNPVLNSYNNGVSTKEEVIQALSKHADPCMVAANSIGDKSLSQGASASLRTDLENARGDCAVTYVARAALAKALLGMARDEATTDKEKAVNVAHMANESLDVCTQKLLSIADSYGMKLDSGTP